MCKTIYYSSRLWMCLYSKTLTYFLLLMISHKNVTTQECSRIVLPINLSLHFLCQIFLATVILFCHNCVFVEWLRCGLNQDRADYHGTVSLHFNILEKGTALLHQFLWVWADGPCIMSLSLGALVRALPLPQYFFFFKWKRFIHI